MCDDIRHFVWEDFDSLAPGRRGINFQGETSEHVLLIQVNLPSG